MFHTSRWNYNVTGGSSDSAFPTLDKLAGKRVGIVGTAATAVQIVPEVAKYAKELYIFQRTPSQVFPRGQRNTEPEEWRERIATGPGWQTDRMNNLAEHMSGTNAPDMVNLVNDEWSKLKAYCALVGSTKFGTVTIDKIPEHIARLQALDAEDTSRVRKRISEIVSDKDTAEKLMPWYFTWCKRPTFSDVYLQTFNKKNVHLIHTDGKGINSLTSHGVVANDQEYPVDVLIFSTGYRSPGSASEDQAARLGIDVIGRKNTHLTEKMSNKGATSLHGCCTNSFPNLFWIGLSQIGSTASYSHTIDVISRHITGIIAGAHDRLSTNQKDKRVVIEPSEAAEEAYAMKILKGAAYYGSLVVCTPGYLTQEGEFLKQGDQAEMMKRARGSPWVEGIMSFSRMLEAWRTGGKFEGMEINVV
jgi:cation diffusion facilitator CzcD-associated flavoprotein CzcO